jgi:hypothetical protein
MRGRTSERPASTRGEAAGAAVGPRPAAGPRGTGASPSAGEVAARAGRLGHSLATFAVQRRPLPPSPPPALPGAGRRVQRGNGPSSMSENVEMEDDPGVEAMSEGEDEDLETLAVEAWDSAIEEARAVVSLELGVEVSVEEVERYFTAVAGIEDPREVDFELDDRGEFESFCMEVASAVASFPDQVRERMETPSEAYERYSEIYATEHEGKGLDPERLKQNTVAFAQFLQQHGVALPVVLAQRSYPGMKELAEEHGGVLATAPSHLLNVHAEMLGLYLQMQSLVDSGLVNVMLHVHPSQPVCFFCEVMLRLFNVEYDREFVDRRMFPGWIDPSGYFKTGEQRYFTPRMMLELFGIDVEAAALRILPLFADVDEPKTFVRRILEGELQGQELKAMIRDLKKASPTLAKANEKARGGGTRKPSKGSKAGRRALREQQERSRQRRRQQEDEASGKVDYPVQGLAKQANRAQWRRYLQQISVLDHTGNRVAAAIIEEINAHPARANDILDRLRLGKGGAIDGYLRGG